METLFRKYKKGDNVPMCHPHDNSDELSNAIFGSDVNLYQNKMEFILRPEKKLTNKESLIYGKTIDEIPEWIRTLTMMFEPNNNTLTPDTE